MFAMMEAPTAERRCRIEEVFTTSFIELLAMAPRNPIVRSLVLSLTRKMPPAECHSFEQIKDWVEFNCEKKLRKAAPNGGDGFSVSVSFEDRECGRATYSVSRSGTEEFRFEADELQDMARTAVDEAEGLDGLLTELSEQIEANAWDQCQPCMEDGDGDYDYSDHETDDTENRRLEFSKEALRHNLIAYLREHHPDLLEELT